MSNERGGKRFTRFWTCQPKPSHPFQQVSTVYTAYLASCEMIYDRNRTPPLTRPSDDERFAPYQSRDWRTFSPKRDTVVVSDHLHCTAGGCPAHHIPMLLGRALGASWLPCSSWERWNSVRGERMRSRSEPVNWNLSQNFRVFALQHYDQIVFNLPSFPRRCKQLR